MKKYYLYHNQLNNNPLKKETFYENDKENKFAGSK